jgi:hypothetical protein
VLRFALNGDFGGRSRHRHGRSGFRTQLLVTHFMTRNQRVTRKNRFIPNEFFAVINGSRMRASMVFPAGH